MATLQEQIDALSENLETLSQSHAQTARQVGELQEQVDIVTQNQTDASETQAKFYTISNEEIKELLLITMMAIAEMGA